MRLDVNVSRLVKIAASLHGLLFGVAIGLPLVTFFYRVAPWQIDVIGFLREPSVGQAFFNTCILALSVAILSLFLGFCFSWLLWRYKWHAAIKRTVELSLKVPYLLPPFFFAMGWITLAAPEVGLLNRMCAHLGLPLLPKLYGLGGTIFVETLWSTALVMIQLQSFFRNYPGLLEDAAIMCGATPLQALVKITLPLARENILSCALLTMMSVMASFGVPAMLASPDRQFFLTTKIFQSIRSSHDFKQAALLSIILLTLTGSLLMMQRFLNRRHSFSILAGKSSHISQLEPTRAAQIAIAGALSFAFVSCFLPCAALLLQSLLRDPSDVGSVSFEKYLYVFTRTPDGIQALGNSLLSSSSAALVATVLGLIVSYGAKNYRSRLSKILIEVWNIGYALPGTVIALALLVFYAGSLTDTLGILILAYIGKYAAFSLRTLTPALIALGKEFEEAAWMSGASRWQSFYKITVPMLSPAIAASFLLALVPMISELTMSALLVGTGTETVGALIYKLQEYADPGSAAVLAVVATTAILALNAALRRFSKGNFGI